MTEPECNGTGMENTECDGIEKKFSYFMLITSKFLGNSLSVNGYKKS